MTAFFSSLCRLLPFLGLVAAGPVVAQHLPSISPFTTPPLPGGAAPVAQTLEFHGFFTMPDGMQYVVVDRGRKTRAWLKLNQRSPDLDVTPTRFDAESQTLTVLRAGSTLELPLRRARTTTVAAPGLGLRAVPPAPALGSNVAPVPALSASSSATLERVRTDIQNRRDAREQEAARERK